MHPSTFSASAEPSLSSVSSSSSVSEDCECLECEQTYRIARRSPFLQRSFPSLTKLQVPVTPLLHTLPSPITLQRHKAQMASMGYSKFFNLGYFSATGALQSSG